MKLIILLGIVSVIRAQAKVDGGGLYSGHQLWRVTPGSVESLEALNDLGDKLGLDFWKEATAVGQSVDIRVAPNQAKELRSSLASNGISDIEVRINDIQELINRERAGGNARKSRPEGRALGSIKDFDYTRYHDADDVYEWINAAEAEFDYITKKQVAVTYEGRPMYVLEIKKPSADGSVKPVIYLDALIHCREWITTASVLFIFKEMLTNQEYSHMIDNVDWYFVPMLNIDGYVQTWTGDRLWRKTRSTGASSTCKGIDANRNWDAYWSMEGASPNPCSNLFYGPTAASESEVRHLQRYIMRRKDEISAVVSVHSYSQFILYANNYLQQPAKDDALLNATGKAMSDVMFSKHGTRYTYGPGWKILYVFSGTTTDWTYEKAGITLSYTFELRDTGEYGFLLPADQIIPTGEEFILGLQWLANYVDSAGSTMS